MKKSDKQFKVVIVNPPTKEQAKERIKKLSEHLSRTWTNLSASK